MDEEEFNIPSLEELRAQQSAEPEVIEDKPVGYEPEETVEVEQTQNPVGQGEFGIPTLAELRGETTPEKSTPEVPEEPQAEKEKEKEEENDDWAVTRFGKGAVRGVVEVAEGVADTIDRAIEILPGDIDDIPGADWTALKDAITDDDSGATMAGNIAGRVVGSVALTAAAAAAAPGAGLGVSLARFALINGGVNALAFNETVATELNKISGLEAITPDALVIDEDDGYWDKKLKVAGEGLGLGAIFGLAFEGGKRGLRSLARARASKRIAKKLAESQSTEAFAKLKATASAADNVRVNPDGTTVDISSIKSKAIIDAGKVDTNDIDDLLTKAGQYADEYAKSGSSAKPGDLNINTIAAADGTGVLYIDTLDKSLTRMATLAKTGKLKRLQKELPDIIVELSEKLDTSPDDLLVHLASTSNSVDDLPKNILKAKLSLDLAGKNLERATKKLLEGSNRHNVEIQREFSNAANFYRNVALHFKSIRGDVSNSFKALGVVLDESLPMGDDALNILSENWGGKDGMVRAARMLNSLENKPVELIASLTGGEKALEATRFLYLNALLSDPVTHMKNVSSTAFNSVFQPLKRIAGGLVRAPFSKEVRKQIRRDIIQVQALFEQSEVALKSSIKSFKKGQPILESSTKLDIDPSHLVGTRLDFQNPVVRKAFDGIGRAALPVRALVAEDEFFKQSVARAHAKAGFMMQAYEDGLSSDDAAKFAALQMRKLFAPGGKFRNFGAARTASQFRLEGTKLGLIDDKLDEFVANRLKHSKNLTRLKQAKIDAIAEAKRAAYQEDSPLADKIGDLVSYIPGAFFVQPFVKTPVNLTTWMYDHSIVFRNGIFEELRGAKGVAAQNEALGRFMTASAFWTYVWHKVQSGEIRGSTGGSGVGDDYRISKVAREANMSNVIDIYGKRVSLNLIEPLGQVFSGMSTLIEIAQRGDKQGEDLSANIARAMTFALADTMKDRAFTSGMFDFMEAFMQGERGLSRWLKYRAGSIIPNVTKRLEPFVEDGDVRRRIDATPDNPSEIWNSIRRAAVISRDHLPPVRDVFGRVAKRISIMTEAEDDPVVAEFLRLGWAPPVPTKKVTSTLGSLDLDKHMSEDFGRSAHDVWMEELGKVKFNGKDLYTALKDEINSPKYKKLSSNVIGKLDKEAGLRFGTRSNEQVQALSSIYTMYKSAAKANMYKRVPSAASALERLKKGRK